MDRECSANFEDPEVFDIKKHLPKGEPRIYIYITSRLASMLRLVGKKMRLEPFNELQGEVFTSALDSKISTKLPDWYPQYFARLGCQTIHPQLGR